MKKRKFIKERLLLLLMFSLLCLVCIFWAYEYTHKKAYQNAAITYCEMINIDDNVCGFLR